MNQGSKRDPRNRDTVVPHNENNFKTQKPPKKALAPVFRVKNGILFLDNLKKDFKNTAKHGLHLLTN
jgi:hypothetical protein